MYEEQFKLVHNNGYWIHDILIDASDVLDKIQEEIDNYKQAVAQLMQWTRTGRRTSAELVC